MRCAGTLAKIAEPIGLKGNVATGMFAARRWHCGSSCSHRVVHRAPS